MTYTQSAFYHVSVLEAPTHSQEGLNQKPIGAAFIAAAPSSFRHARTRVDFGSYIGRKDTSAFTRIPAMSIS